MLAHDYTYFPDSFLVLVGKHKEKLGGKNAGPHFRCGHW
jgi:hypothetical protein